MSLAEYSLSEYSLPDSSPSLRGGVNRLGCGRFRGASSSRSSPLATLFSISLNLLRTDDALHSLAACILSMFTSVFMSLLWSSSFSIQLSFSLPINNFGSFRFSFLHLLEEVSFSSLVLSHLSKLGVLLQGGSV